MSSDFRTATAEKRVLNRIAYLQGLAEAPGISDEEKAKLEAAIAESTEKLEEMRAEAARGHSVQSLDLPDDFEPMPPRPEVESHCYPVYVPPVRVLQQWRADAKLGEDAFGDQRDEHRRLLVLLEVVEDLLRILAEENVKLSPLAKPNEPKLAWEDGERPQAAGNTDLAPAG